MSFGNEGDGNSSSDRQKNKIPDEYPYSPKSGQDHTINSQLQKGYWKNLAKTLIENFNAALTNVLVSIPSMLSMVVAVNYHTPAGENLKSNSGITTLFLGYLMSLLIHGNAGIYKAFTNAQAFILMVQISDFGVASVPATTCMAGLIYLMLYAVKFHKALKSTPACVLYGLQVCTAFGLIAHEITHSLGLPPNPQGNRDLITVGRHVVNHYREVNVFVMLMFAVSTLALVLLMKWRPRYPWHVGFFVLFFAAGILNASKLNILDHKLLGEDWGVDGHFHDHFIKYIQKKLQFKFTMARILTEPGFIINSAALAIVTLLETSVLMQLVEFHFKVHPDYKVEYLGVGISNIISGLFGLLPLSLPISKNLLGIKAGAQDFTYPLMSMVILIIFSYFLWSYMRFLPVLLVAVYNVSLSLYLIELPRIISYWRYSKRYAAIFTGMVVVSLFINVFIAALLALAAFLIMYLRTVPDIDSFGSGDIDKIREQAEIFRTKHEANPQFALNYRRSSLLGLSSEEDQLLIPPPIALIKEALIKISTDGIVYQLRGRFGFLHYKTHLANIRHFGKSPVLLDFSKVIDYDSEFIVQYGKLIKAVKTEMSLYVVGIPFERVVNDKMMADTWIEKLFKDNQLVFIS